MKRGLTLALAAVCLLRPMRAETVDDVLARLDRAAKNFTSYTASVRYMDYYNATQSTDQSIGSMRLRRTSKGVEGIIDLTDGPDHAPWYIAGTKAQHYLPKIPEIQEWDLRKIAGNLARFLLLGFGNSRVDLTKDYSAAAGGAELIGSTHTTKIVLTPKSPEMLKLVRTLELWIPDGQGNPIQQKRTEPSGNYQLATFSDLRVNPNPPLPDSAFRLNTPPGLRVVKIN